MMEPTPTKRFVLDSSRSCNIKCKFCYYLHTYDNWSKYDWSFEKVKSEIDKGIQRGNNYMDITGGEPTIRKDICDIVSYAYSKGIKTCIITNGIVSTKITSDLLNGTIDDFLISRHGLESTHDFITNSNGAYKIQKRFINALKSRGMKFRFNCVINKFNQNEIFDIANDIAEDEPYIVNFINMNPHHEWMEKNLETSKVAADLFIVEPILNKAIEYLESKNIGVNVRYYPMCRIKEEYRNCICNDLHVVFDPYEWDYSITPKTFNAFFEWSKRTSKSIENKRFPCNKCDLQNICGGINKSFNKATDAMFPIPIYDSKIEDKNDFYFYRKFNTKTLNAKL